MYFSGKCTFGLTHEQIRKYFVAERKWGKAKFILDWPWLSLMIIYFIVLIWDKDQLTIWYHFTYLNKVYIILSNYKMQLKVIKNA